MTRDSASPLGAPPRSVRFSHPIAVLPAYNAAATLEATLRDIPAGAVAEIILVDDRSRDGTVPLARSLGLTVIEHPENRGYGASQKTGYHAALDRGADLVVMLHPDYQYDPRLIPPFIGFMETGVCDVMMGSRIRTRREALESGMPAWKYVSNRFLTITENIILGQNLGDFHSGFRLYTRQVLETVPFDRNSDDFLFDTQFLAQAAYFGFRLGDAPVPCRYFEEASSIDFSRSVVYGLGTLATLAQFLLARSGAASFRIFEPRSLKGAPGPPP
jgi:glycosyltransferase involved in cell wall biosynthesis